MCPIYEYECTQCGYRADLMRPLAAYPEIYQCPKCGRGAKRVISPFSFTFAQPNSKVRPGARQVRV